MPSKSDFKDAIAEIAAVMGVVGKDPIIGIKGLYMPKGIKNVLAKVLAVIGIREPPYVGKWLPITRLEYPVFCILLILIIVTGFIKLFKVELLAIITPLGYAHNVIFMASVLHGIATVLLIPLIIIHIIDSVTAVT